MARDAKITSPRLLATCCEQAGFFDDTGILESVSDTFAAHTKKSLDTPSNGLESMRAALRIAAMFHDIGKSTNLFQKKLKKSTSGKKGEADAVRHELVSAVLWDCLTRNLNEEDLVQRLMYLSPSDIDDAMKGDVISRVCDIFREAKYTKGEGSIDLSFLSGPPTAFAVGLLILGHHRLPMNEGSGINSCIHCNIESKLDKADLAVAKGVRYWHDISFLERLKLEAARISDMDKVLDVLDLHARSSLMLADHFGSSEKQVFSGAGKEARHFANTTDVSGKKIYADTLDRHTERVTDATLKSFDALIASRNEYPGIKKENCPASILDPVMSGKFGWQGIASTRAAALSSSGDGGFFACIIAGTGTGKTRAAPTILAAACFNDARPERRSLRFTLGLGLRTLASQSGKEYINDIDFSPRDVSVMIGKPIIDFPKDHDQKQSGSSESEISGSGEFLDELDGAEIISGLRLDPKEGSGGDRDWMSGVPDFIIAMAGKDRGDKLLRLASSPIICATIDHVISAASAERSKHLAAALRIITGDMILDEVDQYAAEDLAVVARLAWLVGAAGRRLIIMSATITSDIAGALYEAYRSGWRAHAKAFGHIDQVHAICASDKDGAIMDSSTGADFMTCFRGVVDLASAVLNEEPAKRIVEILEDVPSKELPQIISAACSRMHDRHYSDIDGYRISIGFVKMTRVSHTVSVAAQLPAPLGRARFVACLHSRFAPVIRSWLEKKLKATLTRKGSDPDKGLRDLCHELDLFRDASASDVRDIEIVLVCSPVIETGNDLDFDYAILDPSSTRSVVQAAGRVLRHRAIVPTLPNIALLARPAVTLSGKGRMMMPGVETDPSQKITLVHPINLSSPPYNTNERLTVNLLGVSDGAPIDARMINGDGSEALLPRAEAELVRRFFDGKSGSASGSVVEWTSNRLSRHGIMTCRMRRFRRQTSSSILLWRAGERDHMEWSWDRLPGRSDPRTERASFEAGPDLQSPLFRDILENSLADYGDIETISEVVGRRIFGIDWPLYDRNKEAKVMYSDDLGLFEEKSLAEFG